jgi:hypothetical protein
VAESDADRDPDRFLDVSKIIPVRFYDFAATTALSDDVSGGMAVARCPVAWLAGRLSWA